MKENVRRLLKQQAFEVLNEERSSVVTRRDGVIYRIWPHHSWTMQMDKWFLLARDRTYPNETWVLLCWIPGTRYWFTIYANSRQVELWHDLKINNKGE